MSIQVSCPQCQKSYAFPDDKRGKQVRCKDCFQVFFAGEPSADAEPPAPPPPASRPAARPQPAAVPRTHKPLPKKPAPLHRAAVPPKTVWEEPDSPPPPRRRKSGALGKAIVALVFLLLMAGGAGATVGALWYLHVPPFQVASADVRQAANQPADAPAPDGSPPAKADRNDAANTDRTGPEKPPDKSAATPDQTDPTKTKPPDKSGDPAATPVVKMNRATFDQIARGMSREDLTALCGQPTNARPVDSALIPGVDMHLSYLIPGANATVDLFQGKVVDKINFQNWPVAWPDAVAQKPPPIDTPKAGEVVSKTNFDKIDKGMSLDQLKAFLGPPDETLGVKTADHDTRLAWTANLTSMYAFLMNGKVVEKDSSPHWPITYPNAIAANPPPLPPPPPPPPPPAKPAGRATKENFDKIAKGMTLDDLTALLGAPPTSIETPPLIGTLWTWRGADNSSILVTATQGKVVDKTNGQQWPVAWPDVAKATPPPPPPPPPDKPKPVKAVTKDNFDLIAKGMSRDDLIALLGPPADVKAQPQPGVDERLIWQGDGGKVLIGLTGGKVVSKLNTLDWPIIYPK